MNVGSMNRRLMIKLHNKNRLKKKGENLFTFWISWVRFDCPSLPPNVLIRFPKITVIMGCDIPFPIAPTVPATINATSRRSAKEKSL